MNVRDCPVIDIRVNGNIVTALTVSANSDPIDVSNFVEAIVFLPVTAHSGTTPTLDCKVQYSPDKVNWVDSGDAFTQITTTNATVFKKLSAIFGKYIRLVFTITGTTPSYTVSPTLVPKS